MRRTLAAPGLAAVLGMALLLTACGKTNAHNNTAGETVSTALFDFSITDVSLVESYPGIDIPDGECLVRMRLNIKNTSSQTYTMFLQDFQIQWGESALYSKQLPLSFLQISLVKYHYGLIELNSVAAVYAYLSYHAVKFALYFAHYLHGLDNEDSVALLYLVANAYERL